MKRLDYSDAKMWYEEGVSQCDAYSIDQLTTIWLSNERMRPSMRSLMNKCLNCLTVKATEDERIPRDIVKAGGTGGPTDRFRGGIP